MLRGDCKRCGAVTRTTEESVHPTSRARYQDGTVRTWKTRLQSPITRAVYDCPLCGQRGMMHKEVD